MKKISVIGLSYLLLLSCQTKQAPLSDQLRAYLQSHLTKIDSTVVLDSFRIIAMDSIDQRMERIIDDTLYLREFYRVQGQFIDANIKQQRKDSIEFYQDELKYMMTQVDSLTRVISKADTTKKLGLLAICRAQLSKQDRKQELTLYFFLDWGGQVWNPEMIDTAILGTSKRLK
jgi:hypothetical protein